MQSYDSGCLAVTSGPLVPLSGQRTDVQSHQFADSARLKTLKGLHRNKNATAEFPRLFLEAIDTMSDAILHQGCAEIQKVSKLAT